MQKEKDDTISVKLPASIDKEIGDKIAESIKNTYYGSVATIIADRVKEQLEEDGFCDRVAAAVITRMKLDEDEYTEGITNILKEQIINTVGTLASEVLEKVQEKFKSYGFIKIGDRY